MVSIAPNPLAFRLADALRRRRPWRRGSSRATLPPEALQRRPAAVPPTPGWFPLPTPPLPPGRNGSGTPPPVATPGAEPVGLVAAGAVGAPKMPVPGAPCRAQAARERSAAVAQIRVVGLMGIPSVPVVRRSMGRVRGRSASCARRARQGRPARAVLSGRFGGRLRPRSGCGGARGVRRAGRRRGRRAGLLPDGRGVLWGLGGPLRVAGRRAVPGATLRHDVGHRLRDGTPRAAGAGGDGEGAIDTSLTRAEAIGARRTRPATPVGLDAGRGGRDNNGAMPRAHPAGRAEGPCRRAERPRPRDRSRPADERPEEEPLP